MQKLVLAILILFATSSPAQDVDSFIELQVVSAIPFAESPIAQ